MEQEKLFIALLDKYINNSITPLEHNELFELIASGDFDHLLEEHWNLHTGAEHIDGPDIPDYRAEKIMRNILSAEKKTAEIIEMPRIRRKANFIKWTVAASVAGLIAFSGYLFLKKNIDKKSIAEIVHTEKELSQKVNNTQKPLKLEMEDGTVVTLQPDSKLHFPEHFSPEKREVYLEGEAFFEVSKNPDRPFFVYNNDLVTHVLGTSFNVRIDKTKKQVEVVVVTGRVQVYENKEVAVVDKLKKTNGVILTPNQKVIYKEDERQFTTMLVSNPLPVKKDTAAPDTEKVDAFVFQDVPLAQVLKQMEAMYGIEMITENNRLNNCLFNGNIGKYDMYSKLDIICQSLNASYEINGLKILIKGKGCG